MAEDKPPNTPPGFTAVEILEDPTPERLILNRIVRHMMETASKYSDLNTEEGNDFLDLLFLIARKMCSVWKHLDAYHAEEKRLIEKFADPNVKHFEFSQVLYEDFDIFAVQIKSTLDHLVKVMRPMIGRSWTLTTFAEKGERVLSSLQRNTGKKHKGRVKSMEFLLFGEEHKMWLETLIASRDRVNHGLAGGLKIDTFAVLRRPDGKVEIPMWDSELELGKAMSYIWTKFFSFVEDFLMLALHFRIPEDKYSVFRDSVSICSPRSPWSVMSAADAQEMIKRVGFKPV